MAEARTRFKFPSRSIAASPPGSTPTEALDRRDDRVDPGDRRRERRRIADVARDDLHALRERPEGDGCVSGIAGEHADRHVTRDEPRHDLPTEEARSTCDEDHRDVPAAAGAVAAPIGAGAWSALRHDPSNGFVGA